MIREVSGDPSAFPVPPASAANQNIPPPLSKNAQKREKKRLAYLQKKEERARERKPNHPIMRKRNLFHSQLKKSRKNGKNNELNFLLKMARLVRSHTFIFVISYFNLLNSGSWRENSNRYAGAEEKEKRRNGVSSLHASFQTKQFLLLVI